jgi:hypothetical protein
MFSWLIGGDLAGAAPHTVNVSKIAANTIMAIASFFTTPSLRSKRYC